MVDLCFEKLLFVAETLHNYTLETWCCNWLLGLSEATQSDGHDSGFNAMKTKEPLTTLCKKVDLADHCDSSQMLMLMVSFREMKCEECIQIWESTSALHHHDKLPNRRMVNE